MSGRDLSRDQEAFDYRIARSRRRRSISLEVRDAQVIVRAPMGVSADYLDQMVRAKQAWVQAKLAAQRAQLAAIPERSYRPGSSLPWLGRDLTLVLGDGLAGAVNRHGDQLRVVLSRRSRLAPMEQTRRLVARWYQDSAHRLLAEKTGHLAGALQLPFREVRVRATRSKWGHCTSAGVLQYNWQIVLAPEPVVDYLVAHEVCHLQHPNHSAAFWQLVERVCPDYRNLRAWLKTHGRSLVL